MRAANDQSLLRSTLEHEIERLISLLDRIDGDPDLEANGDEHDQTYPESGQIGLQFYLEDSEDGGDDEPEETDQDGDELDCSGSEEELDPTLRADLQFDGSGVQMARNQVKGRPTFWDRPTMMALIADGADPNRSEIERMRR
jgi:hypothetical protein